jgi:hypothetical protein
VLALCGMVEGQCQRLLWMEVPKWQKCPLLTAAR